MEERVTFDAPVVRAENVRSTKNRLSPTPFSALFGMRTIVATSSSGANASFLQKG